MSAVLEQPKTELTLVQRAAVALGTAEHELKLRELVKQSAGIIEVKNGAGRDECHAAYMRLKNSRIGVEKASKTATEDAKAFAKAVTGEERRLIAIVSEEEERLQTLRDAWDAEVEVERQRKIAAERERVANIRAGIDAMREEILSCTGRPHAWIQDRLGKLRDNQPSVEANEEFQDEAMAAWRAMIEKVAALADQTKLEEAEAARLIAERKAEDERRAAEAELLLKQRAELERERAAQAAYAAEQQRIANEAAAKAEAQAKAERDAANAELKAKQDAFNAEQAAARAETARQAAEAQRVIDEANRVQREAAEAEQRRIAEIRAAEDAEAGVRRMHAEFDAKQAAQAASDLPQIAADLDDDAYSYPIVLNAPKDIYLNVGDLDRDDEFANLDDVSWCAHPQGESDIKYLRADFVVLALHAALPLIDGTDEDSARVRAQIVAALVATGE